MFDERYVVLLLEERYELLLDDRKELLDERNELLLLLDGLEKLREPPKRPPERCACAADPASITTTAISVAKRRAR